MSTTPSRHRLVVVPGGPGFGPTYLTDFEALIPADWEANFADPTGPSLTAYLSQIEGALGSDNSGVLVGHSFGGLLALHLAIREPRRVRALILLDPDPATYAEWVVFRERVAARQSEVNRQEMERLRVAPGWPGEPGILDRHFRLALMPYFSKPDCAAHLRLGLTPEHLDRIHTEAPQIRRELGAWDLRDQRCSLPALLIHGADSIFAPQAPETLHGVFPLGESHVLDGVGHFPHLEAPKKTSLLVHDFLGRLAT